MKNVEWKQLTLPLREQNKTRLSMLKKKDIMINKDHFELTELFRTRDDN